MTLVAKGLKCFSKVCRGNSSFIKIRQEQSLLCLKTNTHFSSYLIQFFLEWKNISDKRCRETRNTHFMFNHFFFNRVVYEIMWKTFEERNGPQMTIWHMRIACWIPKATNTHTSCVILIAFPLQQWLHERASMLRLTYLACLVNFMSTTGISLYWGMWNGLL